MRVFSNRRLAAGALAWVSLATLALAAPVTAERMAATADEPQNWLTSTGDFGATRYSMLSNINTENVSKMRFLFSVALGPISVGEGFRHTHLSPPLVVDGMAYVVDAFGVVYGIDVSSGEMGKILWSSARLEQEMDPWLLGQWSLTLHGDSIILGGGDGRLFWIDRADGTVTASASIAAPSTGYVLAAPPVLVGDILVLGGAGGDRGARVELTGVDATTGDVLWRSYPAGENGSFVAGGSVLRSGAFDPESGLVLWSTSGPLPAFSAVREGANATNAVLAVNPQDGAIAWQTGLDPDLALGTSEAATPMLSGDGKAVQVGDDGLVRRFDIASGALDYAEPFVEGLVGADAPAGCPNIIAEAHMPSSLSARSGLVYAAQHNGCRADLGDVGNLAGEDEGGLYAHMTAATGALSAIDPATGAVKAEHFFDYPLQSGLLSTAGGLVIAATADGSLHALDDETLEPLWSLHVSSFMATPPVTYAVGDQQYVAMIVGGGPLYSELPMRSRSMAGVRHVSVLAVFGVAP